MPFISAGILAGGSILGSVLGGSAQSKAAKEAAATQRAALDFSKQVYGTASGQYQPYIGTGTNALYSLASLYGLPGANGSTSGTGAQDAYNKFTQLPSYQFPYQQGMLAANRSLAAQGLTGSGAQAKALTQYGQGYASNNFNNYLQQLAGLAGMGQNAIGSLGSIGNQAGTNVNNISNSLAGTQAGGILGQAGSINTGIGNTLAALGQNQSSGSSFGGANSAIGQGVNYLKGLFTSGSSPVASGMSYP
jgi:hypothetical protein